MKNISILNVKEEMVRFLNLHPEDNNHTFEEFFEISERAPEKRHHEMFCIKFAYYLSILCTDSTQVTRKLSTELIQLKQEKAHDEQVLDSIQNALADNGYKLVDINE